MSNQGNLLKGIVKCSGWFSVGIYKYKLRYKSHDQLWFKCSHCSHSDWGENLVKGFFAKINFPPLRALEFINGHMITWLILKYYRRQPPNTTKENLRKKLVDSEFKIGCWHVINKILILKHQTIIPFLIDFRFANKMERIQFRKSRISCTITSLQKHSRRVNLRIIWF